MLQNNNADIDIRIEEKAGRITLNRPGNLNALTYEMVKAIEAALLKWREDGQVQLVIIDATGDRAFCAGGDIQKLYDTGIKGEYGYMRKFWADEYRLNALIANYSKPYVAFMDGIVMGGGVGVSAHGSQRIVTRRTMLAMPECAIGLVPDVGGSLLLAKSPGHVGEYMGTTGARLNAADAIHAGFADILVELEDLAALKADLIATGNTQCMAKYAKAPQSCELVSMLEENANLIETYFSVDNAMTALNMLEEGNTDWVKSQAKSMRRACPLSIACTWQMVKNARSFGSIEQALAQEYRFTWASLDKGDVLEGVRALIIDKDRNPKWKVKRLEDVTDDMVSSMLASLGTNELNLNCRQDKPGEMT